MTPGDQPQEGKNAKHVEHRTPPVFGHQKAAGEHADGQKDDESRKPQTAGQRRRRQANDEQHARQEDVTVARQTGIIPEVGDLV